MINAVICEFNPFHNGHKYLLEKAREKTGADATVCFMSGNFVQRGAPAVCRKHERAVAAVKNGADLVIQIPTAYTLAGASIFAGAGVLMASSLNVETSLCFGSESENLLPLFRLALVDKDKLNNAFKTAISQGRSYSDSVMRAYSACCDEDASLLKQPNNLLAFEYIKAVIEQKSDVKLVNILRRGVAHDGDAPQDGFASASYIRKHADEDMSRFMPQELSDSIDGKTLETALLFSVYGKTAEELLRFADMGEGLNNRVYSAARCAQSASELYELIKSRRYTHSRIRRAVMNVLIQNPAGLCKTSVPYLNVLAFNDKGRELLKTLDDTCTLPLVTKPSRIAEIDTENAAAHFELECRATDVYDFCCKMRRGGGTEYRISPVYVR